MAILGYKSLYIPWVRLWAVRIELVHFQAGCHTGRPGLQIFIFISCYSIFWFIGACLLMLLPISVA